MTCSARQFAFFRIALGVFLVHHFASLIPFGGELYGSQGLYSSSAHLPLGDLSLLFESDRSIRIFLFTLTALACALSLGFLQSGAAFLLWLGWASLVHRLPVVHIPSEGLVGWLLLFVVVAPSGKRWGDHPGQAANESSVPSAMIGCVWGVLAVGYLASGVDKLSSPSWQAGTAVRAVLSSPMAYWEGVGQIAHALPVLLIHLATWSVLAIEILVIALIWHPVTRALTWILITAMHVAIRALLDLHTVTDPFLIAQILTFDASAMRRLASLSRRSA